MIEDMKRPLLSNFPFSRGTTTADGNRTVPVFSDADAEKIKEEQDQYPKNIITSSRYTLINFLPKSLLEQFRRLANVYFLVIGMIAVVAYYTNAYETAVQPAGILGPVIIVVLISVIKDGVEDIKRHRADHAINTRTTQRMDTYGKIEEIEWRDIKVGDVLLITTDEELPADCVVLNCGGIQGPICYVETAAIDGETNLKMKLPGLSSSDFKTTPSSKFEISKDRTLMTGPLGSIKCNVFAEAPNSSIHRFNAYLRSDATTRDQIALTEKNLLLRGSTLRATEWCLAAVVYTGAHTKLSLNSKRTPSKLSSVDRIVNRTLAIAISTMILVCIISMIFESIWAKNQHNADYLCIHKSGICESAMPSSYLTIFTFATLYNNFVCISMYVSLEMVYLCQGYFLSNDLKLYDEDTDTPAECHSSGACADLGQVQYVLSDKTGTLTKNLMVVQQFSIGNKVYGKPLSKLDTIAGAPPVSILTTDHNHSSMNAGVRTSMSVTEMRPSKLSPSDFDTSGINDVPALLVHTLFYPALEAVKGLSNSFASNFVSPEPSIDSSASHVHSHSSSHGNTIVPRVSEVDDTERLMLLQFLRVLVYCNTAMLMPDETGRQEVECFEELIERLQAESADEVALIMSAADNCGVLLEKRTTSEIACSGLKSYFTYGGAGSGGGGGSQTETVELLAVNEFDSDRKMMSVVVRLSSPVTGSPLLKSRTMLLCKGADSSVIAQADTASSKYLNLCKAHIDYFANTGLRTLALAYKELDEREIDAWLQEYYSATSAIAGRKEAMRACALKIETNLTIVGSIGIEDELQDGVPDAIATLHSAGVNVWMITGDKAETAVAIGKKCHLINPGQDEIVRIVQQADEALRQRINDLHNYIVSIKAGNPVTDSGLDRLSVTHNPMSRSTTNHIKNNANGRTVEDGPEGTNTASPFSPSANSASTGPELAFIIDGISLEGIWSSPDLKNKFMEVVQFVPKVIACRVSPLQKAALVRMVKTAPSKPVTLGIGDGANDVGMIHESRVGVGISGREGRHAANAADFAIAQFRFIIPLMFEHGRYNYIRCSKLVLYSFFKNLLLVSVLFYYCTYSGFSGTMPLDSIVFSGYNFYLGLPILVVGAMDFDIPRQDVLRFPKDAYATGRLGEMLNLKNMAKWCGLAFVQGLLLFVVTVRFIAGPTNVNSENGDWTFEIHGSGLNQASTGSGVGLYAEGFLLYTVIVFSMQYKVVSMSVTPNYIFWLLWLLSFAGYFIFILLFGVFPTVGWYNVGPLSMSTPQFWLAVFLIPIFISFSDYLVELGFSYVDPSSRDLLVEKLRQSEPRLAERRSSQQDFATGLNKGGMKLRNMSLSNGSTSRSPQN
jgi:phospholipid-translocating ATPase